jgi:hypothetical protein
MKYVARLLLAIFSLIAGFYFFHANPKQARSEVSCAVQPAWQEAVDYAKKNLPLEGKLIQNPDGFVYLKVDDNYIHKLFPLLKLKEEGFREPPYFRSKRSPGAHISVFYVGEKVHPKELGSYFHFEPKKICFIKRSKKASLVILQVESAELETLRKKYGLSPKLQGHEFHISLGTKEFKK